MASTTIRRIAVAALAAAGIVGSMAAQAAEDPIKLGAVYIRSGSASSYGAFAEQGMKLAIEQINDNGGVLGRQLEYEIEDSQGNSGTAIQAMRKLVYQENVDALMGIDSSGVAQGVASTVPQLQTPLIITHAATPDVTGKMCNDYVYRLSVNIVQNMRGAAEIAADSGAKRWTTIGPDYAFGRQSWDFFGQALKEKNPDAELMSETAFPRFGAEEFTPFINSIMDADPDGVLISLWGGDLVNFVRQASDMGFFDEDIEVMFTVGAATEVLDALGDKMPEGVWLGTRYWFDAYDNETNRDFVAAYKERYDKAPSYNAEGAYAAVYAYKAAMEKAGTTDGPKVAETLAGMSFDSPMGEITFRAGDHQTLVGPTWGKAGPMDDEFGIRSLTDVHVFDGEDVTPAVEETGCSL